MFLSLNKGAEYLGSDFGHVTAKSAAGGIHILRRQRRGRGFGKVYACLRRGREGYVRCLRRQNPF